MRQRIVFAMILVLAGSISHANQWHDEADRCWNEALKFKARHDYKQAIEYLKRAVIAERKNEHPRSDELIAQLNELGRIHDRLGRYDASLRYYRMALEAARKFEDAEHESAALNSIGESSFKLARYDDALAAYSEARDVAAGKGYNDRVAQAHSNMALTYRVMKEFDKALDHLNRAKAAAAKTTNEVNIAVIISNIGTLHFVRGDYDEALDNYSTALAIDQKLGVADALSIDLSNMGGVYAAQGKYGEALNYFEQALKIDSNNKVRVASRLNRIGDIYFSIGYNDRAIEFFTRSLDINTKMNNRINEAAIRSNIGKVYDSMGRYEEAMDHYVRALSLNRNTELNENLLSRLGDIGMVYESRERYGEAVDYLNRAIRRDIQEEKRERIANNLGNLGRVMISSKRYDQAIEYFDEAAEINRNLGDDILLADNLSGGGIASYYSKDYDKAVEYLSRALKTLESKKARSMNACDDVRTDAFRWLVASYVKTNKADLAYEAIERQRGYQHCTGRDDDADRKKSTWLSAEHLRKNIGKNSAVVIFSNIAWDDPQAIVMDSVSSTGYELDKAAMVNAVYNARGKEIERFMSQKKGDIVFNIQQRSRKDHYVIEFEKIVNYYRSLLGKKFMSRDEYEIMQFLAKSFYTFLFKKIEKQVADKSALVIQPDSSLALMPFETLIMDDGRFFAEKFEVRYAWSQTTRDGVAKGVYPPGRRSLLSVEGITPPVAPSAKKIESARHFDHIQRVANAKISSGKDVREAYGYFGIDDFGRRHADLKDLKKRAADVESIIGERATEEELTMLSERGTLANYKIIHFAGCGIVVPEAPMLGALAVSVLAGEREKGDGVLNIRELSALNLQADLISIQEMKINPIGFSRGEGIGALCCSLMTAGARGVACSLWPVEDGARLAFMARVYEMVLKKNISVGTAIAETKRAFIHGLDDNGTDGGTGAGKSGPERYSNPYFWGSWLYYGN